MGKYFEAGRNRNRGNVSNLVVEVPGCRGNVILTREAND